MLSALRHDDRAGRLVDDELHGSGGLHSVPPQRRPLAHGPVALDRLLASSASRQDEQQHVGVLEASGGAAGARGLPTAALTGGA